MNLEFVRNLRNEPTEAEHRLWYYLRDKRLSRYRFRRQHPIPPYIADFCCVEKRLIIELDGSQHADEKHLAYDQTRDEFLKNQNFQILRFWNNQVLMEIDYVLDKILDCLENAT